MKGTRRLQPTAALLLPGIWLLSLPLHRQPETRPLLGPHHASQAEAQHSALYRGPSRNRLQRITEMDADWQVSSLGELQSALEMAKHAEAGVIYVLDHVVIDLTGYAPIILPENVTLASGRGGGSSHGGLLYTRDLQARPMILVDGPGVRITGLRFRGPSADLWIPPEASGIFVRNGHDFIEIDHCELSAWPRAAIDVAGYDHLDEDTADRVHIHHNFIHQNQQQDFGYGVVIGDAYALIEMNVFDYNRHAIAASGDPGSGYVARYNLVLEGGTPENGVYQHSFDMHCFTNDDEGECDPGPAGEIVHIHHNSFQFFHRFAFRLRGRPEKHALVEQNTFIHDSISKAVTQINALGNMDVVDNVIGYDPRGAYALGDFDGDGRTDLFQAAGRSFFYSSGGALAWQHLSNSIKHLDELRFGDFDKDGKTDVFSVLPEGDGFLRWRFSSGGVERWEELGRSKVPFEQLRFGDFDCDGTTDVFSAVLEEDDSEEGDFLRWRYSSGGVENWRDLARSKVPLADLRFGDFDGDGTTDVFSVVPEEDDFLRWRYSSGGVENWRKLARSRLPLGNLRFGDFDGDDHTDVFGIFGKVWRYSSAGAASWRDLPGAEWPLADLRFGDFTGDSRTDVGRVQSRLLHVSPSGQVAPVLLSQDFRF